MDELLELVRQCRAMVDIDRKLGLLDEIIRIIRQRVLFRVRSLCANEADVDDVLQNTLVKIATKIGRFQGSSEGEFFVWCFRIAHNTAADYYRRQAAGRLVAMPPEDLHALLEAGTESTAAAPSDRLDAQHAVGTLAKMTDACREYLTLFFLDGMSYQEIASILEKSYDAVRIAIERCLREARRIFRQ